MAADVQRQRISFSGVITLLGVAAVVYFCVSTGQLLILYWLATLGLIGILLVVVFDMGLKKGPVSADEPEGEEELGSVTAPVSTSSAGPAPKRRKRRKRRR